MKETGLFSLKKKKIKTSNIRKDIQSERRDKKKSLYKRDGGGRVIVSSGRCFLCPFLRGHAPLLPLQGTTTSQYTNCTYMLVQEQVKLLVIVGPVGHKKSHTSGLYSQVDLLTQLMLFDKVM